MDAILSHHLSNKCLRPTTTSIRCPDPSQLLSTLYQNQCNVPPPPTSLRVPMVEETHLSAFVSPDASMVVNRSMSCVLSVRRRRRRTFAAPTATNLRVNYANIHTTYRRRRRINAFHWLDSPIAYLCCARYDLHRNRPAHLVPFSIMYS